MPFTKPTRSPRFPLSLAPFHLSSLTQSRVLFAMSESAEHWSSPELCVKVRGSSSMLRLGCLGDLLGLEE